MHIAWHAVSLAIIFDGSVKAPQWYERVTGVIAIPAAMIALAYSYLLIQKTRLESRKLEIEIADKLNQSEQTAPENSTSGIIGERLEAVAEILVNRRYFILILRYIILELALNIYSGLTSPVQWFVQLALSGVYLISAGNLPSEIRILVFGGQTLSSTLISIGYWLVFAALGWPLFKDVNTVLGINLRDYSPRQLIRGFRGASAKHQHH